MIKRIINVLPCDLRFCLVSIGLLPCQSNIFWSGLTPGGLRGEHVLKWERYFDEKSTYLSFFYLLLLTVYGVFIMSVMDIVFAVCKSPPLWLLFVSFWYYRPSLNTLFTQLSSPLPGLSIRTRSQGIPTPVLVPKAPVMHGWTLAAMANSALFELLGLEPTASPMSVKYAFRTLAKRFHPDKDKDSDATEVFQKLNNAYQVLRNSSDSSVPSHEDECNHTDSEHTALPNISIITRENSFSVTVDITDIMFLAFVDECQKHYCVNPVDWVGSTSYALERIWNMLVSGYAVIAENCHLLSGI